MTRVLMTNLFVAKRTGSEIATVELATALAGRGHDVAIYAPILGPLAEEARTGGVVVVDDPAAVPFVPDIIHGHHTPAFVAALASHPGVPAIFVSHSATSWVEAPVDLTRIRRCFAVAGIVRDRAEAAVPRLAGEVGLLLNAVDLARFRRRTALPAKPRRALVLTKHSEHVAAIRDACLAAGLAVDALGPGVGDVANDLPARLQDYDIVFATARMAIEALAVGCAVIVVDQRGLAGLVTSDNMEAWRQENFGLRLLTRPVDPAAIAAEIARYDADDAALVSDWIRADADLSVLARRVEAIHAETIAAWRAAPPIESARDLREIGAFLASYAKALGWFTNPEHGRFVEGRVADAEQMAAEALDATAAANQTIDGDFPAIIALRDELAGLRSAQASQSQILRSRGRTFRHWLSLMGSRRPRSG